MKNNKTKYNHVGRPTNEEVKKEKNKKNLKIIGIIAICLVTIGGIFIFLNKDNLSLESIMGSSVYRSSMLKVQKNSKITSVTMAPYFYYSNSYVQKTATDNKTKFVTYLFSKAGFSSSKYKYNKIQFFSDGYYIKTVSASAKEVSIPTKYTGKTLALKVFATNKSNKKQYVKYLRLNLPSNLQKHPTCTVEAKKVITYNNTTKNAKPDKKDEYDILTMQSNDHLVEYEITCNSNANGWKDSTITNKDFTVLNHKNVEMPNAFLISSVSKKSETKNTIKYKMIFEAWDSGTYYVILDPYCIRNKYNIYNGKTEPDGLNILGKRAS